MIGTDYFNKRFAITPLDVQNSEWAEFDFVAPIDRQNTIEIENRLNQEIRFSGKLFKPQYVPLQGPLNQFAFNMGRNDLSDQIQIRQQFSNKFDNSVTIYDNLSAQFNNNEFARSWEDNLLYHPEDSIL